MRHLLPVAALQAPSLGHRARARARLPPPAPHGRMSKQLPRRRSSCCGMAGSVLQGPLDGLPGPQAWADPGSPAFMNSILEYPSTTVPGIE